MAMFEVTLGYGSHVGVERLVKDEELVDVRRFAEEVEEEEEKYRTHEAAFEWAIGDNPVSYSGLIHRIRP